MRIEIVRARTVTAVNRLDELACDVELLSEEQFLQKHHLLYLYGKVPESSVVLGHGTFVSGTFDGFPTKRVGLKNIRFVQAVAKSGRNDWKRRISVGRSGNNDIVLRHESVSKLHAYFYVRRTRKRLKTVEELVLVDADSSNGTLRNGRGVPPDPRDAKVIVFGDRMAFGQVDCEFLDGRSIYGRLKLQAKTDF